jgi:hypothetical protein
LKIAANGVTEAMVDSSWRVVVIEPKRAALLLRRGRWRHHQRKANDNQRTDAHFLPPGNFFLVRKASVRQARSSINMRKPKGAIWRGIGVGRVAEIG